MSLADAPGEERLEAPERTGETPAGPGRLLLDARRAQGLSIGDVARQLKLAPRQVEALERDDYSAFPGPVFVRGFLRNYAKLLHLDADLLTSMAQQPSPLEPPTALESPLGAEPVARPLRTGLLMGVVALAVLLGLVVALRGGRDRPAERASAPMPAQGMPDPAGGPQHADAPSPSGSAAGASLDAPEGSSGTVAGTAPESTSPVVADAPVPLGSVAVRPVGPAEAGDGARRELHLRFQNESWVEVKDAGGSIVFSQLNAPGSERVVRGVPPLTVVIGNAHGVTLSYRGKPVDLGPHTRVDVARVTLE